MKDEINRSKNVHILVPKGFQGKELLRGHASNLDKDGGVPSEGECMTCRGTGAIFHKIWLEDFEISDGRIIKATPKMAWLKCKCYLGQFWIRFHPLNVRARLFPKWGKDIKEALEREKATLIRESGGSYEPGQDTFLRDAGYKPVSSREKVLSLDDCLRDMLKQKGDFIV